MWLQQLRLRAMALRVCERAVYTVTSEIHWPGDMGDPRLTGTLVGSVREAFPHHLTTRPSGQDRQGRAVQSASRGK